MKILCGRCGREVPTMDDVIDDPADPSAAMICRECANKPCDPAETIKRPVKPRAPSPAAAGTYRCRVCGALLADGRRKYCSNACRDEHARNAPPSWRKKPPSEFQLEYLVKRGYDPADLGKLTRGDLSDLIDDEETRYAARPFWRKLLDKLKGSPGALADDPASDRQKQFIVDLCERLGKSVPNLDGMSKGTASDRIDNLLDEEGAG